jgi:CDP-4-dehydro-6-deoxyglucose reductase, E3
MNASVASFAISVQPSGILFEAQPGESLLAAGIRQGIGLPYGCKDGACGSCKCKLVAGQVAQSNFQRKALSEDEEAQGFVLTCSAKALSDITLESRQVTPAGALPVKKMPTRVSSLLRKTDDVIVMQLQLPANDTFVYRAGQYVEFILRDGARRSYSMANAPSQGPGVELHIRHMPGGRFTDPVFGSMKEKDILRIEGPMGSFFLREESSKPMVF